MTATRAPAHLRGSRDLWKRVLAAWELLPDELERLRLACELLDQADDARRQVETEGAVVLDRFEQPRRNPAVVVQRDAAVAAARLLAGLGIRDERQAATQWPPKRRGGMSR
jgi:phage terminase small subunit